MAMRFPLPHFGEPAHRANSGRDGPAAALTVVNLRRGFLPDILDPAWREPCALRDKSALVVQRPLR